MAAGKKTTALDDDAPVEGPGIGSALVAVAVMLLSSAVLAGLVYLLMIGVRTMPRNHGAAAAPTVLASVAHPAQSVPTH